LRDLAEPRPHFSEIADDDRSQRKAWLEDIAEQRGLRVAEVEQLIEKQKEEGRANAEMMVAMGLHDPPTTDRKSGRRSRHTPPAKPPFAGRTASTPAPSKPPLTLVRGTVDRQDASLAAIVRRAVPRPPHLVADILPQVGAGVLGSAKSAGKSTFAANLSVSMARGDETFLGRKLHGGAVLYIALEHTEAEFLELLSHITGEEELNASPDWFSRFHLIAVDNEAFPLPVEPEARYPWLRDLILRFGKPKVVIVDTWSQFRPAPTGNNLFLDDKRHAEEVRKIGRDLGCFVLLLHHTGKAARGRDPSSDLISTMGLPAGLNVVLGLIRSPGATKATLVCQGNAIPFQRMPLAFYESTLRFGLADAAKVGRHDDERRAAAEFLNKLFANGKPRLAKVVMELAAKAGIECSDKTMNMAKRSLGIKSQRTRKGWVWIREKP